MRMNRENDLKRNKRCDKLMEKRFGRSTKKFLEALPKMGNAVGIAFGVDRFVMLLTGAKSINDVVPFSARERFLTGELVGRSAM